MGHKREDRASRPGTTPSVEEALVRARALANLDVQAHLADPARKQAFVTPMFDVIAPRYDAFTRLFSFGMDASWKRLVVAAATEGQPLGPTPMVVDLACGTGDLAISVARALQQCGRTPRVLGVDASPEMVRLAGERLAGADRDVASVVEVVVGDMGSLALPDGSVDVITAGYGVRNAPDPVLAIREAARVLSVGGRYVTLDFYRPRNGVWRALFLGYLAVAGNVVGWIWHRTPVVYGYIARSIDHFMSWQDFSRVLENEGFAVRSVTRWLGGGVALHVAERVERVKR